MSGSRVRLSIWVRSAAREARFWSSREGRFAPGQAELEIKAGSGKDLAQL